MEKYKKLAINAVLAFVAAFAGAVAVSDGALTKPAVVAFAYAALRVAAGVIAAGVGKPVPVDV